MQLVEMLAQAVGAPEDAAVPAAVEHQQLLVDDVELALGTLHQATKAGFIRGVVGGGPRFRERGNEQRQCVRELAARPARPIMLRRIGTKV